MPVSVGSGKWAAIVTAFAGAVACSGAAVGLGAGECASGDEACASRGDDSVGYDAAGATDRRAPTSADDATTYPSQDASPLGATLDATGTTDSQPTPCVCAAQSDPCPGTGGPPVIADCSAQCAGSPSCNAAVLVCPPISNPTSGYLTIVESTSATIRTPEGASARCAEECRIDGAGTRVTNAVIFRVRDRNVPIRVRVDDPWKVADVDQAGGTAFLACQAPVVPVTTALSASPNCVVVQGSTVAVWTDVPNPPARNIILSPADSCP